MFAVHPGITFPAFCILSLMGLAACNDHSGSDQVDADPYGPNERSEAKRAVVEITSVAAAFEGYQSLAVDVVRSFQYDGLDGEVARGNLLLPAFSRNNMSYHTWSYSASGNTAMIDVTGRLKDATSLHVKGTVSHTLETSPDGNGVHASAEYADYSIGLSHFGKGDLHIVREGAINIHLDDDLDPGLGGVVELRDLRSDFMFHCIAGDGDTTHQVERRFTALDMVAASDGVSMFTVSLQGGLYLAGEDGMHLPGDIRVETLEPLGFPFEGPAFSTTRVPVMGSLTLTLPDQELRVQYVQSGVFIDDEFHAWEALDHSPGLPVFHQAVEDCAYDLHIQP